MPGGPTIVASCGVRAPKAEASARSSCSSSARRPTKGAAIGRVNAGTSSSSSTTRKAETGRLFPLSASGATASDPGGLAHESLGRRADENLAGARSLLEALGDVHCVACGERLAGARDDLPGVDADPHLEPEGRDGVAHLEGRAYRSQGVVLVDLRDTEDRHRRVADELLHRAAVALEDRAQLRVVAGHELAQDLRVGALTERSRADEVAEDDRDRLALLARCGGRRLGAALGAEPERRVRLEPAGQAGEHAGSLGRSQPKESRNPIKREPPLGASAVHPTGAGASLAMFCRRAHATRSSRLSGRGPPGDATLLDS